MPEHRRYVFNNAFDTPSDFQLAVLFTMDHTPRDHIYVHPKIDLPGQVRMGLSILLLIASLDLFHFCWPKCLECFERFRQ